MRVCIPLAETGGGGSYSFFRNLRAWLRARGAAVTDDPSAEADVIFANAWSIPRATIARAKRRSAGARVLHRIDGSAVDYGRDQMSDVRQALVNLWADVTVFQSAYGREATRRRRVIVDDGPVIHNAVDVERFRPDGERCALPGRVRIAHVTFSTNVRKGTPAVYALARRRRDLTFVMVGPDERAPALDNLLVVGYADWERLPVVLRSCDVFLILAENETCPNVVLEALASGLPVLYRASGGTPELVGDCGRPVDEAAFDRGLEEVLDRRAELGRAARRRALDAFAFDVVFPRYLAAAQGAPRRPLPGVGASLAALARVRPGPAIALRWLRSRAAPAH